MDGKDPILRVIAAARRRMRCNRILDGTAAIALGVAALFALLAIARAARGNPPVTWEVGWIFLGAVVFGFVIVASAARISLREAAAEADRRGRSSDRLTSAWRLREVQKDSPLADLAIEECAAFARTLSPRTLVPIRIPRKLAWMLVPAAAVAVFAVMFQQAFLHSAAERAVSAKVLEEAAETIGEAKSLPELGQMADRMREEAETMKRSNREDSREAALRSVALAAEAVRELAAASPAGPGEVANGSAARGGENSKASGGKANSIRPDAESKMADGQAQRLLSEAGERAAESEALQTGRISRKELQRMAGRLEQLKQGLRGGQSPEGSGSESALAALEKEGQGQDPAASGDAAESQLPGGAGSERDFGTSAIDGIGEAGGAGAGPEDIVSFSESDGAAAVAAVISTDGPAKSNVAYRQAYETAVPAAEETVFREELPPGSRVLVKRYFESIRPAE